MTAIPPAPRMLLAPGIHPDEVTLLDWYAAAILMAKAGSSSADIFDKAAAMVAESHKRKGIPPCAQTT